MMKKPGIKRLKEAMAMHEKNAFWNLFNGHRGQSVEKTTYDEKGFLDKPAKICFGKGDSLLRNLQEDFPGTGLLGETLMLDENRKLERAAEVLRLMLNIREC